MTEQRQGEIPECGGQGEEATYFWLGRNSFLEEEAFELRPECGKGTRNGDLE